VDSSKQETESQARKAEKVKKYLDDKNVIKVIHVPNKLINFVVK
jgi:leucyl-tRNA synthetase